MSKTRARGDGKQETNKKRLRMKTIIYAESKANQWLDDPPLEIWDHHIIPLLGLKDLALSRHVCTFFEAYWQDKFSKNVLPMRVPQDVASIDQAMRVIEILSSRREYTKASPLVVLLDKGNHEITSSWTDPRNGRVFATTLGITRSNITFLGNGKDTTTILGGFGIDNSENIMFKQMTVTNINGTGIRMSNGKVEFIDVAIEGCVDCALLLHFRKHELPTKTTVVATRCEFANCGQGALIGGSLTSATFKNCVFKGNSMHGFEGSSRSTVHLHGEATAIHSNGRHGIYAYSRGKVLIHLPSHHNTSYNNTKIDQHTGGGGTITNVED